MAVTKTSIVSVLIVLAITYNQGAARPSDVTNNELSSSEVVSSEMYMYKIPTAIKKGLLITITVTIDTNQPTFNLELPSISGKESCQISFSSKDIKDTEKKHIHITPAVDGYDKDAEFELKVTPGSNEGPSLSLKLLARVNDMFEVTFFNGNVQISQTLACKIDKFDDINQIVIKKGVARVESLLFEF